MVCLTKEEVFQSYRALIELQRVLDTGDSCFVIKDKDRKDSWYWITLFIVWSPLLHVLYYLILK